MGDFESKRRGANTGKMGRRHFFAAAGIPAVALAATSLSAPDAGAETDIPTVLWTTVAQVRAMTGTPTDSLYLIADDGMEGAFAHDAHDVTSADNTGTILVTASGARLKRRYDGPVDVRWFGAKGDGVADDTVAIQAAIDVAQLGGIGQGGPGSNSGGAVHLPSGQYMISSALTFKPSKSIHLFGDGRRQTRLIATQGSADWAQPMLKFLDKSSGFQFTNFMCHASGLADYCIDLHPQVQASLLEGLSLAGARQAGLRIYRGWFNQVSNCYLSNNFGDGVAVGPDEVNDLNLESCVISSNHHGTSAGIVGHGVAIRGGKLKQQIAVVGCTASGNAGSGIMVDAPVKALTVARCYFENNLRDPQAAGAHVSVSAGCKAGPISIRENHAWMNKPDHATAAFVECYSARGELSVSRNHIARAGEHTAPSVIVRTRAAHEGGPSTVENLVVEGTYAAASFHDAYSLSRLEVDDLAGGTSLLHQARFPGVVKANYAPPLVRFAPTSRSTRGSWRKSGQTYRTFDVWEIGVGGGPWGFAIDLADYPELANAYVYFACWVKPSDASTAAVLTTSQLGPLVDASGQSGWHVVSYCDKMPTGGSVNFSVGRSGSSQGPLLVAHPVMSEVGVPYGQHDEAR